MYLVFLRLKFIMEKFECNTYTMPLQSISDLKASSRLSIVQNHDNTHVRDGLKYLEVQSKWITLSKYPLQNKKKIREGTRHEYNLKCSH